MRDDTQLHPRLDELKATLKPCPFCGHKAALRTKQKDDYIHGNRWWYNIICGDECCGQTAWRVNLERAIEMWNNRTPSA